MKEQSDAAHAAYEKALADARARAQEIANAHPRAAGGRGRGGQQDSLRRSCTRSLPPPRQSIAATRTSAMGNVGSIATDTASAIVERLIGKAPADHEVAAAVGDALKR